MVGTLIRQLRLERDAPVDASAAWLDALAILEATSVKFLQ